MNLTPEQMATRLRTEWPKASAEAIGKGAKRGLDYAAKLALREVQKTGLGRALIGRYGISGLDKLAQGALRIKHVRIFISTAKLDHRGNLYYSGLVAKGFSALIETGGKTKPHGIDASPGKILANVKTREGFGKHVHHPGSRVPREPYLERSVQAAQGRITAEIDKGFDKLQQALVG